LSLFATNGLFYSLTFQFCSWYKLFHMSTSGTSVRDDGKVLGFWADTKLVTEIQRVAKLNDRSVSAELRQAVRDYLRQYEGHEEAA
jgi:hypothetical protein